MTELAASTRRFTFSAGHRYWVDAWSREENERFFGRLTVPHGHNYTLDVTVRGPIDPQTGMVIDLAELKRVWATPSWSASITRTSTPTRSFVAARRPPRTSRSRCGSSWRRSSA